MLGYFCVQDMKRYFNQDQVSIYLMAKDDKDYCVHFLYMCVCE